METQIIHLEYLGWIASLLFAFCGAPQAWMSFKQKHSDGITWLLLIMWMSGELLMIIYVMANYMDVPLMVNFILNIFFVGVMIWYKIPREIRYKLIFKK